MFKTAEKDKVFVLTREGYERTPEHIKSERKIGEPVKGYEHKVPLSWIEKGYVEECGKKLAI